MKNDWYTKTKHQNTISKFQHVMQSLAFVMNRYKIIVYGQSI